MLDALRNQVTSKAVIRANLTTYRFYDNVRTGYGPIDCSPTGLPLQLGAVKAMIGLAEAMSRLHDSIPLSFLACEKPLPMCVCNSQVVLPLQELPACG